METVQTASQAAPRGARSRILEAADGLFYEHGIRAISADRIIELAGITKVTFYRHFRTKSDLVVAYLEQQAAREREWMTGIAQPGLEREGLRALAAGIGGASCAPGFRGCAFINASAEFADPDDPVRIAVDAHRGWMHAHFAALAAGAGAEPRGQVADQLLMLRDGAMVSGYLAASDSLGDTLARAFDAVLDAHV